MPDWLNHLVLKEYEPLVMIEISLEIISLCIKVETLIDFDSLGCLID